MVVGIAAGNTAGTVLKRSIMVMAICWLVGRIVGHVAQKTIESHIEQYKSQHPIPAGDAPGPAATQTPREEKTTA